jgi:hypothetical protein
MENIMTASNTSNNFAPLSNHGVENPKNLHIRTTKGNLLTDFNRYGYDGYSFFGTAFIQGRRLQFTTAMPFETLLRISEPDPSQVGDGVDAVIDHANRPRLPSHAKALRAYFLNTACEDEKFILPAFALNFGDNDDNADAPEATLLIYAESNENSTNGWPALFQLPGAIKLDITDGGHRSGEIKALLNDKNIRPPHRENLRRNACDVKIIFESKRVDSHQDFADCAKAKPITGSLITTFDVRDLRSNRTLELVKKVPFLMQYVDATAANVNLSGGSKKIWSMSAVRGFTGHVQGHYPPTPGAKADEIAQALADGMDGAEEFFEAVIPLLPQLNSLSSEMPPAKIRNLGGGDVLFRGAGLSVLARAFVHAKDVGMEFDEMAKTLSRVDWHLLDCERDQLPNTGTVEGRRDFAAAVQKHLNPLWSSMLIIGEMRYKIASSAPQINDAWERIIDTYHLKVAAKAA